MNRRQYLARAGAGVPLAAFAGCLDDLPGGDSSGEGTDRTGERELDRAAGNLNDAALALNVEADTIEDPERIEFDPAEPADSIATARDHLETAATELGADREPDIETLRTYADVLEALVVVADTVTDDTLSDDFDSVSAATGGDSDLEDASATMDDRRAEIDEAKIHYDDAVSEFRSLDDRFKELARIERADLEGGISTLGDVLGSFDTLAGGFESILDGYGCLERGHTHVDNGAYDQAEGTFTDAESAFEAAATLEGDETTPDGLTDYFETARCQGGHLTDAAAAFADSAAAGDDGDPLVANRKRAEGERELENATECGQ
ncbi:hypothetical protein [Natronorubrum halophilum]|uniref:hypothetical protein n=1 Tax=Natronorubrum halophilum TaxID=1702106 RepID=UPI0010C2047D|nr:hypothetical protein [Natronorubrum halophilum]